MSRSKHTPGPWVIDSDGDGKPDAIVTSTHRPAGLDDDVCEVYGGNDDDDDVRAANANLIAAAPDLLAVFDAAKRLLEAASIARGAPQDLVDGNFAHHADQIAAGWRDLKEAVTKVEADHAEVVG